MNKKIMAFLLFCLLVIGVFFYTEWIKENEKRRVAYDFIEKTERMLLTDSIHFEFDSEIKISVLEIFIPLEIIQKSQYKSDFPVMKGSKEGIIILKNEGFRRTWISNNGDFFVVEGIEGYFLYDAMKLEEWKKSK